MLDRRLRKYVDQVLKESRQQELYDAGDDTSSDDYVLVTRAPSSSSESTGDTTSSTLGQGQSSAASRYITELHPTRSGKGLR